MVIPEALSYGLPVVCFDNYGPGELCDNSCAIKIPYGKYDQSINDFALALDKLYTDKKQYQLLANGAINYAHENFHWSTKASKINKAYALVG